MSAKIYRQGDILFKSVDAAKAQEILSDPKNEVQPVARVEGRIIVAEGEVTGHHHAISTPDAVMLSSGVLSQRWVVAGADGLEISHEEHNTVTLPEGTYWIIQQREYQRGTVRQVLD